ncbi:MAG: hypothetical protein C5B49_05740 [Bdellovibrio sp.]|nr:MAG: hypothetical protein C5B49_05740 [Bdellovibrio sp.]
MGFEKARGFHQDLVEKGVECNYAHYMKIESGKLLPSPKIVEQISTTLAEDVAKDLVISYCRALFPTFQHFFPQPLAGLPKEKKDQQAVREGPQPALGRELTRRQVAVLAKSKSHYYCFLIMSVARRPLQFQEIKEIYPQKGLMDTIHDLEGAHILRSTEEGIQSVAPEHRFPREKDFPELKPFYRQFDQWDESFAEDLNFVPHLNKMFIRRISPRYLEVIEDSLNTLLKLVRASDELDPKYNDNLVQIRLSLKSGALPG